MALHEFFEQFGVASDVMTAAVGLGLEAVIATVAYMFYKLTVSIYRWGWK